MPPSAAPSFIEIKLTEIDILAGASGEVSVQFTQAYRSNTFNERVRKTLLLVREAGEWKILREVSRWPARDSRR